MTQLDLGDQILDLDTFKRSKVLKAIKDSFAMHTWECQPWEFATCKNGYGKLNVGGHSLLAHRVCLCIKTKKPYDYFLEVRHKCGNPGCINTDHLLWGSHWENMNDVILDKAMPAGLTWQDLLTIRESNELHAKLASRYNVKQELVEQIQGFSLVSPVDLTLLNTYT